MSYQTQDNHDYLDPDTSNKKLLCTFSVRVILVWLLTNIGLNATGLALSLDNPNATCYTDKSIGSLSSWLQLITIITLIDFGFYLLVILLCLIKDKIYAFVLGAPYFIFILFSSLFHLFMTIIGIIELSNQYPSCKNEVLSICIMVIIIVICNLISMCGLLKVEIIKNDYIKL